MRHAEIRMAAAVLATRDGMPEFYRASATEPVLGSSLAELDRVAAFYFISVIASAFLSLIAVGGWLLAPPATSTAWTLALTSAIFWQTAACAGLSIRTHKSLNECRDLAIAITTRVARPRMVEPVAKPVPVLSFPVFAEPIARVLVPLPSPLPSPSTDAPVSSGKIGNRDCVTFADGSVQVETLLGMRRFVDMSEAREYIGA